MTTTIDQIRALDHADPLSHFRDRFSLPDGVIYLDGNSLGALPSHTKDRLDDVIEREWGQDLIRSWNTNHWIEAPRRLGGKVSELIGAEADEVVVADSTSVNIFKALSAGAQINSERDTILSESGNFPTDAYMMEGLAALSGGRLKAQLVGREALLDSLDESIAVLLLTQTHYKTGALWDMEAVARAAQDKGILVIWDLSHSAGALPVDLNACDADFAVGCGYKYLNGGPGAPAFLFAAKRHHDKVFPALSGWMGHRSPFAFDDHYKPGQGIDRFQCGTPGILGMAAMECGLDLMLEADMAEVRKKSMALGDLFIKLVDENLSGFRTVSPRLAAQRGSQVSIAHPDGYAIMQALIERGVIGDFRAPDLLRFGFTPLYTRYEDVWRAVSEISAIMDSGEWQDPRFAIRAAVT